MTTYTSTGMAVYNVYDGVDDIVVGIETGVVLSLLVPDTTTTLSYTTMPSGDPDDIDIADIIVEGGYAYLDGALFMNDESFVLEVTWKQGTTVNTSTVLGLFFEDVDVPGMGVVDMDVLFTIDGAPLPDFTTPAQWEAFDDDILSVRTPTGTFGPGRDIPLTSVFETRAEDDVFNGADWDDYFDAGRGDDVLNGFGGNDQLIGGSGDDTINPGDNTDYDYIRAGTGNDRVILSDVAVGYVDLDHFDLDAGIKVNIDGNANTGRIDKGVNGTTTLVDVANPILAGANIGGLGIQGTGSNDVFRITVTDGGWMSVAGHEGNDRIVIGDSSGSLRLDYRSALDDVTVNLKRGRAEDGLGGTDRIKGPGDVWEVRTGMYDDKVIGSGADESFILMAGSDVLNGGGGFDRIRYDRSGVEAVEVDLKAGTATGTWWGESFDHSLRNIEWVRGSRDGDDRLAGDKGDNQLDGRGGNDLLIGRGGKDALFGEDGRDVLKGGSGNDWLDGGSGNDTLRGDGGKDNMKGGNGNDKLFGGRGNDWLDGGAGNDKLKGNAGNDVFDFSGGRDIVLDFQEGDSINLVDAAGIRNFRDLKNNHVTEQFGNLLIEDDNGNVMVLKNIQLDELGRDDFLF